MKSALTGLERDMGNGRLTFKEGKNVVVKRVEGYQGTTRRIDYTPQTNPKHVKVIILLDPEKPK